MRVTLGMLLVAAAVSSATAGPLEDAQAAYARGDRETALRSLRLARLMAQDVTGIQVLLGQLYAPCKDEGLDYSEVTAWIRKYADRGNPRAQFNLGNLYLFGRGVPRDLAEAMKWFRLAAEQGEPDASHNLGYMYEKGQGVPQDHVRAYVWISLSASRQTVPEWRVSAARYRDVVAAKMTPAQLVEAQALAQEYGRLFAQVSR